MPATFRVIALSSLDPDGRDARDEPELAYPDALIAARALKDQGKAFRVLVKGQQSEEERQAFLALGALSQ